MCAAMFPGAFDALGAVQKWIKEGIAPDQIKTTYAAQGRQFRERAGMQDTSQSKSRVLKTRPVCPYPQVAIYMGSGDTHDAANFKCGKPTWKQPGRRSRKSALKSHQSRKCAANAALLLWRRSRRSVAACSHLNSCPIVEDSHEKLRISPHRRTGKAAGASRS